MDNSIVGWTNLSKDAGEQTPLNGENTCEKKKGVPLPINPRQTVVAALGGALVVAGAFALLRKQK